MTELIPVQKFFRFFSLSHLVLALAMVLLGLSLRFFSGWHTAGFAFFAFGLSCLYMGVASGYTWQNWFLEGEPNPDYEKKRQKQLLGAIGLGVPFWGVFGLVVVAAAFEPVDIVEYTINKTPQFDKQLQRILKDARDKTAVLEYTDTTLVIKDQGTGVNSAIIITQISRENLNKNPSQNSHIFNVSIDGSKHILELEPHKSFFRWTDDNKNKYAHEHLCEYHVPYTISPALYNNTSKTIIPIFIDTPTINDLDITLKNNSVVVKNFFHLGSYGSRGSCKRASKKYLNERKVSGSYLSSLGSAPDIMVVAIAFPSFSDAVLTSRYTYYVTIVTSTNIYLKRVTLIFNNFFR